MHVRVIGGGIGGLTTAVGLGKRGIDTTVHEAATQLRPVGGAILLWPNALVALSRLGLAEDVRAVGTDIERLRIHDDRNRLLRSADLTATIGGTRWPGVYLPRPALQDILRSALPDEALRLGEPCVEVEPGGDDGNPTVHFEDRRPVTATVVVGADGIGSTVRRAVVGEDPRRETGTVAYRGIAEADVSLGTETKQFWGPGTRVGIAPLKNERTYWFATANGHVADRDRGAAVLDSLGDRYGSYPDPIPTLIDRTSPDCLAVTELSDIAPLNQWHRGQTALLGDAAHATLPYLGQGAGQAIEDAVALVRRLANRPPAQALSAYVDARKRRAEWVVRLSRLWWYLAQLEGTSARARNTLVRYGPTALARRQQRWLAVPRL